MAIFRAFYIFRASFDRGHHHGIAVPGINAIADLTFAFEHKTNRSGLAQITAVFGKRRPDI